MGGTIAKLFAEGKFVGRIDFDKYYCSLCERVVAD
jgi:hypothetical protein